MRFSSRKESEVTEVMSLDEMPDVLKVEEMAKLLRIGRGIAYEMVRRNEIRSLRFGRAIRIPKQAVVEYLSHRAEEE
jgi:excisionase family DNA binding protein